MEYLAVEVRRLVYTVICFQCLIQLTEGSGYQKYLKLFSYFISRYLNQHPSLMNRPDTLFL